MGDGALVLEEGEYFSKRLVKWFWEVLKAMTPGERQAFLRFVSGRSRLPANWVSKKQRQEDKRPRSQPFELHVLSDSEALEDLSNEMHISSVVGQTVDDRLPTASTCFFTLKLPKYSSKKVLREKLLLAINLCTAIDLDGLDEE
eukprot:GDKI01004046.1.p1 GENE.GDKI01004046.1~~GDKI01004046.1.p1  ORF type:complete len:144 (-),score=38.41 GDKI01004046.1:247-678(-)